MDPREYSTEHQLKDGQRLKIRAICPDDKAALSALFDRLSPQTIYYRFHGAKKQLSRRELTYLTELNFHDRAALVALLGEEDEERIVGVARYAIGPDSPRHRAEIALTVEDAEQGRGIGTLLLEHLNRLAREEGIEELEAYILSDNHGMIRLLESSGRVFARQAGAKSCHLIMTTGPDRYPAAAGEIGPVEG